jgi:hypothetical protein
VCGIAPAAKAKQLDPQKLRFADLIFYTFCY